MLPLHRDHTLFFGALVDKLNHSDSLAGVFGLNALRGFINRFDGQARSRYAYLDGQLMGIIFLNCFTDVFEPRHARK